MELVNPFEEIVLFGKALPLEPVSSTRIGSLVPTGKHVSHANKLYQGHGPGVKPARQELQVYRHKARGLKQGPFGKALGNPGAKLGLLRENRGALSAALKKQRLGSSLGKNPNGARQGVRL